MREPRREPARLTSRRHLARTKADREPWGCLPRRSGAGTRRLTVSDKGLAGHVLNPGLQADAVVVTVVASDEPAAVTAELVDHVGRGGLDTGSVLGLQYALDIHRAPEVDPAAEVAGQVVYPVEGRLVELEDRH